MRFLLCILFVFSFSTCYQETDKTLLLLDDWELRLEKHKSYKKTKIINWESKESGIKEDDYNGFGIYKAKFVIPSSWYKIDIAFYTPCIDDSDTAYFNGEIIGSTGSIPDSTINFQSGVREARLYRIPKSAIKWDEINTLKLKVYDYSSIGGFCYSQQPILGDYKILNRKKTKHLIFNNFPRMVIFCITLILIGYMLNYSVSVLLKFNVRVIFYFFIQPINIFQFFSDPKTISLNFELETAIRYLYGIILFTVCAFFISSEFTFKYQIIELSEEFWFKYPPVSFQIGQLFLLSIIHPDVFGKYVEAKWNFKTIAAVATHPVVSLIIFFYLISLKPENAWNMFALVAIFINTWIMILLLATSGVQLILSRKIVEKNIATNVYRQGLYRIFLAFCSLTLYSLVFFYPEPSVRFHIRENIFLLLTIILYIFSLFAIYFSHKYKLILPLKLKEKKKPIAIFAILQTEYNLTYNEAQIASLLYTGSTREIIKSKQNITEGTLKNHLKSIYSKTIDKNSSTKGKDQRKLYRLINFLHDLEDKSEIKI